MALTCCTHYQHQPWHAQQTPTCPYPEHNHRFLMSTCHCSPHRQQRQRHGGETKAAVLRCPPCSDHLLLLPVHDALCLVRCSDSALSVPAKRESATYPRITWALTICLAGGMQPQMLWTSEAYKGYDIYECRAGLHGQMVDAMCSVRWLVCQEASKLRRLDVDALVIHLIVIDMMPHACGVAVQPRIQSRAVPAAAACGMISSSCMGMAGRCSKCAADRGIRASRL